ncbi:MAG: DUF115 domain-containing protein [Negativicutes bacterium]|nr:DUF115 domain-containing protein [Negativicutes bacterium]
MNIYQKNIKFFKNHADHLYHELKKGTPLFPLTVRRITKGGLQIERDGGKCLLHSSYSIEQEMESMFAGVSQDTEILVVFGFGAGHFLPYVASHFKNIKKIMIIEPALQIFDMVLHECDLGGLIRMPRQAQLTFVLNQPEKLAALLTVRSVQFNAKVEFVAHLSYRSLYSEYYQSFNNVMADWFRLQRLELQTHQYSLHLWLENTVKNLVVPAYPGEIMKDLFYGKPAIIVSAGPSLEKHMHLLEEAQHKAIIVAVGTATKVLDKAGIRPHFRAAMDSFEHGMNIFENLTTTDIPLLFANQLYPGMVACYPGPLVRIVKSDDYFGQYLCELDGQSLIIPETGPSIANLVLSLLCEMKCPTVIIIGQDMCFKEEKIHAEGGDTVQEQEKQHLMTVRDIYGNEVQTLANYWSIKGALERSIANNPKVRFINATEGGLGVDGAENRRLADVLDELAPLAESVSESIAQILAESGHERRDYSRFFGHENLVPAITEIMTIAEQSIESAQAIAASIKDKADRSYIDKKIALLGNYEKKLQETKLYKRVFVPYLNLLLETFTNLYQGKATAEDWNTRVEAIISERVAKSLEIHLFCEFIIKQFEENLEK